MNLALEKGERVTMGGKSRGEIRGETWEKGIKHLVDGGWQLEKWRYCWWLVGLIWTEV